MPERTTIEKIMTKDVFFVEIDDTVHKADEIMREENIKHIPVVEKNKFVGLITDRTLREYTLRNLYDFDDEYDADGRNKITDFREIMDRNVHVVYPEDSIEKAVKLMTKHKVECLAVVDWSHNLVGILTTFDALLFLHEKLKEGEIS